MTRFLTIILALGLTACASCKVQEDSSLLSAAEAGDLSVVFVTAEDGPRRGGAFVFATEGGAPEQAVRVVLPSVKCHRDSCIGVQVVRKDGTIIPIGGAKKGSNSVDIPLSKLTALHDEVQRSDGGPYRVLIDVFLLIPQGVDVLALEEDTEDEEEGHRGETVVFKDMERHRQAVGVIYLNVLARGYARLTCGGPDTAYIEKIDSNCRAEYSTKLRSALCCKEST